MRGGAGWQEGMPSNNKQHSKSAWFDEHALDWTTVYVPRAYCLFLRVRGPNSNVAKETARWADHKYYLLDLGHCRAPRLKN